MSSINLLTNQIFPSSYKLVWQQSAVNLLVEQLHLRCSLNALNPTKIDDSLRGSLTLLASAKVAFSSWGP